MRPQAKLVWMMSTVAVLAAACGGGGDDAPAPAPAYTQADATTIAKLGALTVATAELVAVPMAAFHEGFLASYSTLAGGSATAAPLACLNSGQFTTTTTKAAARVGFAVGDSLAITYDNCISGPFALTGNVTLVAQTDMANLGALDYSLGFRAQLASLAVDINGTTFTHDGTIDVTSVATGGNVFATTLRVPQGALYEFASSTVGYRYGADSSIASEQSVSPSTATLAVNGPVRLAAAGSSVIYFVATPTTLSGPFAGGISPTAGVLETAEFTLDLETSTTFAGAAATVRADTNRDNTLDLQFSTTWAALVAP